MIKHAIECLMNDGPVTYLVNSIVLNKRLSKVCRELDSLGIRKNLLRSMHVWSFVNEKDYWTLPTDSMPAENVGEIAGENCSSDLDVEIGSDIREPSIFHRGCHERVFACERKADRGELSEEGEFFSNALNIIRENTNPLDGFEGDSTRNESRLALANNIKRPEVRWPSSGLKIIVYNTSVADRCRPEIARPLKVSRIALPCKPNCLILRIFEADPSLSASCLILMKRKFENHVSNACSCLNNILSELDGRIIKDLHLNCEIRPGYINFRLKSSDGRRLFTSRVPICRNIRKRDHSLGNSIDICRNDSKDRQGGDESFEEFCTCSESYGDVLEEEKIRESKRNIFYSPCSDSGGMENENVHTDERGTAKKEIQFIFSSRCKMDIQEDEDNPVDFSVKIKHKRDERTNEIGGDVERCVSSSTLDNCRKGNAEINLCVALENSKNALWKNDSDCGCSPSDTKSDTRNEDDSNESDVTIKGYKNDTEYRGNNLNKSFLEKNESARSSVENISESREERGIESDSTLNSKIECDSNCSCCDKNISNSVSDNDRNIDNSAESQVRDSSEPVSIKNDKERKETNSLPFLVEISKNSEIESGLKCLCCDNNMSNYVSDSDRNIDNSTEFQVGEISELVSIKNGIEKKETNSSSLPVEISKNSGTGSGFKCSCLDNISNSVSVKEMNMNDSNVLELVPIKTNDNERKETNFLSLPVETLKDPKTKSGSKCSCCDNNISNSESDKEMDTNNFTESQTQDVSEFVRIEEPRGKKNKNFSSVSIQTPIMKTATKTINIDIILHRSTSTLGSGDKKFSRFPRTPVKNFKLRQIHGGRNPATRSVLKLSSDTRSAPNVKEKVSRLETNASKEQSLLSSNVGFQTFTGIRKTEDREIKRVANLRAQNSKSPSALKLNSTQKPRHPIRFVARVSSNSYNSLRGIDAASKDNKTDDKYARRKDDQRDPRFSRYKNRVWKNWILSRNLRDSFVGKSIERIKYFIRRKLPEALLERREKGTNTSGTFIKNDVYQVKSKERILCSRDCVGFASVCSMRDREELINLSKNVYSSKRENAIRNHVPWTIGGKEIYKTIRIGGSTDLFDRRHRERSIDREFINEKGQGCGSDKYSRKRLETRGDKNCLNNSNGKSRGPRSSVASLRSTRYLFIDEDRCIDRAIYKYDCHRRGRKCTTGSGCFCKEENYGSNNKKKNNYTRDPSKISINENKSGRKCLNDTSRFNNNDKEYFARYGKAKVLNTRASKLSSWEENFEEKNDFSSFPRNRELCPNDLGSDLRLKMMRYVALCKSAKDSLLKRLEADDIYVGAI